MAAFYLDLFRYVMLAKVEKRGEVHTLSKIASGYAVALKGKETIIDSQHTFGADLGFFGKRILADSEQAFEKEVAQVVQTPSLRLIDDHQLMRRGQEHVPMVLRYAVLVSPRTGRLRTAVWLLSEDRPDGRQVEADLQFLPDGYREKYLLSVKREGLSVLNPAPDATARQTTPQGTGVAFTPQLRQLAGLKAFTLEQVQALEQGLRDAVPAPSRIED